MSRIEIERIREELKQVREERDRLSNEEFDNALIALLEKRYDDMPTPMQREFGLMARVYQLDPKFREGLEEIANEQAEKFRQDVLIIK